MAIFFQEKWVLSSQISLIIRIHYELSENEQGQKSNRYDSISNNGYRRNNEFNAVKVAAPRVRSTLLKQVPKYQVVLR